MAISSLVSAVAGRRQVAGALAVAAGLALVAVTYGAPDEPADRPIVQVDDAADTTNGQVTTTGAATSVPATATDRGAGGEALGPPTTDPDQAPAPEPAETTRPAWVASQVLPTDSDGVVVPQTTPAELIDRRMATADTLPAPAGDEFELRIEPLSGDPLARSTWNDSCPVTVSELRYVTATFWGFDDRPHQGELVLRQDVAEEIGAVFRSLYEARFPIEEMRVVTRADIDGPPTGDGNNTASFACREVVGGTHFSEHAYGLAIDVNPFQNPYVKGALVLPELAEAYTDRSYQRPGMIFEGDVVVEAFDTAGWGWGGRWQSLKDYQHFALNNR
jgi:hypothetical protein